jgi:hypothetical protein
MELKSVELKVTTIRLEAETLESDTETVLVILSLLLEQLRYLERWYLLCMPPFIDKSYFRSENEPSNPRLVITENAVSTRYQATISPTSYQEDSWFESRFKHWPSEVFRSFSQCSRQNLGLSWSSLK